MKKTTQCIALAIGMAIVAFAIVRVIGASEGTTTTIAGVELVLAAAWGSMALRAYQRGLRNVAALPAYLTFVTMGSGVGMFLAMLGR